MPPFVLTVLKIALLALLYFFVYRAVRAIALDLSGRAPRERRRRARAERGGDRQPRRSRGGAPSRVVLLAEGRGKAATHKLDGTLSIGRDPGSDIRLEDTYASAHHARISRRGSDWVLEDLGSTNGTYLNQQKVAVPTTLAAGDRIRIGKTVIEVRK